MIHFIQANIDCSNSYVVQFIAFDYDKVSNLGNLSRINPALLGTKDVGKSIKNSLASLLNRSCASQSLWSWATIMRIALNLAQRQIGVGIGLCNLSHGFQID